MGVLVELGGILAAFEEGEWKCDDPSTKAVLDTLVDPEGPSGADPDPDMTMAEKAKRVGAVFLSRNNRPDSIDPKVVY
jgi:hypothetical protein